MDRETALKFRKQVEEYLNICVANWEVPKKNYCCRMHGWVERSLHRDPTRSGTDHKAHIFDLLVEQFWAERCETARRFAFELESQSPKQNVIKVLTAMGGAHAYNNSTWLPVRKAIFEGIQAAREGQNELPDKTLPEPTQQCVLTHEEYAAVKSLPVWIQRFNQHQEVGDATAAKAFAQKCVERMKDEEMKELAFYGR
jgi:hypothetical protein